MGAFIEMCMHILFLGNAESNFKLADNFKSGVGRPGETFKKTVHAPLKNLTVFNLSRLLVPPFLGSKKGKLTAGTWVSENWLACMRMMKVVCVFCLRKGVQDERLGANDLVRMMSPFTAMIARLLSHSGMRKSSVL